MLGNVKNFFVALGRLAAALNRSAELVESANQNAEMWLEVDPEPKPLPAPNNGRRAAKEIHS